MDIHLDQVSLTYMKGTPFERLALKPLKLTIKSGMITGIIGHTGSGKSSLIQLISGLIQPTTGTVSMNGFEWSSMKKKTSIDLRKKIGVVFQYPEYQLFEETVEKDIAFGPKNFGFKEEEIDQFVREAMELVGLPYNQYAHRSPFELSGGQMRRVAIAGVIAFQPEILILDEPTAGLDPRGRKEILEIVKRLHLERKMTTIFVTHSMDEVANLADQLIVLSDGRVVYYGSPKEVFQQVDLLRQIGLDVPEITKFIQKLNQRLEHPIPLDCYSLDELEEQIVMRLKKGKET
ncbi:energy-coupling factor transporter ATPase [Tepidibacillus fermentans]|uniref:Energy-coupling factor transporter ATP-binding protein EcfA2 n=1 Tax=Tepidibacillus fermentans TaxID=1281767 RepID=A0A4R3KE95_9BACI|nr:energy-coupling factor transporter ATPase [Tepidibacillus fermentans]TCS81518.1 energy-coupling factor transport system ATP-binding protein [Tepidibacillus fermentans]